MKFQMNWKVWAYWSLAFVSVVLIATGSQITRLSFGSISISALITAAVSATLFVISAILVVTKSRKDGIKLRQITQSGAAIYIIPIVAFLSYVALSLFSDPTTQGFQNLLSMSLFGIGLIVFSILGNQHLRKLTYFGIYWGSAFFSLVSILFVLIQDPFIDGRAFAMTAVVGLAAVIPLTVGKHFAKLVPILIFVAILFSASRIATLAALIVIGFIGYNSSAGKLKNIAYMVFSYMIASSLTVLAYLVMPALQKRLETGDQALVIDAGLNGGASNTVSHLVPKPIVINTNGRIDAWREFLGTVKTPQDIFLGQGTGSSAVFGQQHLPYFPQVLNEYLRVFLDNGVIGLILFIAMIIALFIALMRPLKSVGPFQMSGFLVLMASSVVAITDGQFIYPFTALTSGLVVGLGLIERARSISPVTKL